MPIRDQDLWVVGSRLFVQRDPVDVAGNGVLVNQPWVDLGTMDTVNATVTPTVSKLKDGVSGILQLIDSRTARQVESYSVVVRNLSPRNWNLFLRGRAVQNFSQVAGTNVTKVCTHRFFPGQRVKIEDDTGRQVYALLNVHGVYTTSNVTTGVVTEISHGGGAGPFTIKVTGDLTGTHPGVGTFVVLKPEGLAAGTAQANAGTYEILSKGAFVGGATVLTVREALASTETGLTGSIVYKSGAGGNISAGPRNVTPAWKVQSLADGIIYAVDGGLINAETDLVIAYSLGTITDGPRLILPQTQVGEVKGRMELFWTRGGFAEVSVRRGRISIIPASSALIAEGDQFSSLTFTLETLTDESAADPDGDLIYIKGALPALT